jgi:hypothetical protein
MYYTRIYTPEAVLLHAHAQYINIYIHKNTHKHTHTRTSVTLHREDLCVYVYNMCVYIHTYTHIYRHSNKREYSYRRYMQKHKKTHARTHARTHIYTHTHMCNFHVHACMYVCVHCKYTRCNWQAIHNKIVTWVHRTQYTYMHTYCVRVYPCANALADTHVCVCLMLA